MMKILPTLRYISRNYARHTVIAVFASVASMVLVDLVFISTDHSGLRHTTVQTLPVDWVAGMFALLAGLLYFTPHFHVALANGISRRTFLTANVPAAAALAALFTLLSYILVLLHSLFWPSVMITQLIYALSTRADWFAIFVVQWAAYVFMIMLGCFSAMVVYQATTPLRWAYFLAPVALYFTLIADANAGGRIFDFLKDVLLTVLGLRGVPAPNPYIATLTLTLGAALLAGLVYLVLRRTPLVLD